MASARASPRSYRRQVHQQLPHAQGDTGRYALAQPEATLAGTSRQAREHPQRRRATDIGIHVHDPLLGADKYGSDNFFTGEELPAIVGFSTVGLSGALVINGLGSAAMPQTGWVWHMWREGATFGYRIPVPNDNYRVTLGLLEPTVTPANLRRFNVLANGVVHGADLDIFQGTGARNTAIVRTFAVSVTNGTLALDFAGVTGKAIVSNIAVVKE